MMASPPKQYDSSTEADEEISEILRHAPQSSRFSMDNDPNHRPSIDLQLMSQTIEDPLHVSRFCDLSDQSTSGCGGSRNHLAIRENSILSSTALIPDPVASPSSTSIAEPATAPLSLPRLMIFGQSGGEGCDSAEVSRISKGNPEAENLSNSLMMEEVKEELVDIQSDTSMDELNVPFITERTNDISQELHLPIINDDKKVVLVGSPGVTPFPRALKLAPTDVSIASSLGGFAPKVPFNTPNVEGSPELKNLLAANHSFHQLDKKVEQKLAGANAGLTDLNLTETPKSRGRGRPRKMLNDLTNSGESSSSRPQGNKKSMDRLKKLIPSLSGEKGLSKEDIEEEAVKYIEFLRNKVGDAHDEEFLRKQLHYPKNVEENQ